MAMIPSPITGVPTSGGTISGNLTVTGNESVGGTLGVTGATTLSAKETISGSATGGLLAITNTAAAAGGTVTHTEAAAANASLGISVSGDTVNRFVIGGDGKHNWGPGNGATDTDLYRVAANILQTDGTFQVLTDQNVGGNINAITAGKGLTVKGGTNARIGSSALTAGSVVVANTSVTASTIVLLTSQVDGGTPGFVRVSTRTAGTSFTITSSSNTDTSTIGWLLVEPT